MYGTNIKIKKRARYELYVVTNTLFVEEWLDVMGNMVRNRRFDVGSKVVMMVGRNGHIKRLWVNDTRESMDRLNIGKLGITKHCRLLQTKEAGVV